MLSVMIIIVGLLVMLGSMFYYKILTNIVLGEFMKWPAGRKRLLFGLLVTVMLAVNILAAITGQLNWSLALTDAILLAGVWSS